MVGDAAQPACLTAAATLWDSPLVSATE